jgi:hypothetical protein
VDSLQVYFGKLISVTKVRTPWVVYIVPKRVVETTNGVAFVNSVGQNEHTIDFVLIIAFDAVFNVDLDLGPIIRDAL